MKKYCLILGILFIGLLGGCSNNTNSYSDLSKFSISRPNACRLSLGDSILDSAVEIKCSFTNNSGVDKCFNDFVIDNAYQDGEKLDAMSTSFFIKTYSDTKQDAVIRNGYTIDVILIYSLENKTSPIELELKNYNGDLLYNCSIDVPEAPVEGMLFNSRWISLTNE